MRYAVKSAPSPTDDRREFVMSDNSVDRMGDVIDPAGWDLSSFKQGGKFNPIALFNHDKNQVVGSWADVQVKGNQLIGRFEPAAPGTSEIADSVRKLVEQDILRAVSVGFEPNEREPLDEKAKYGPWRYTRQTTLECSIVSVPANANAVAIAKQLNLSPEIISVAFGEQAEMRRGNMFTIGKHAVMNKSTEGHRTMTMTPSQRIEHTQQELNASRDRLAELNNHEVFDVDAAEKLNGEIDNFERALTVMKAAESRMATTNTAMTTYTPP